MKVVQMGCGPRVLWRHERPSLKELIETAAKEFPGVPFESIEIDGLYEDGCLPAEDITIKVKEKGRSSS